MSDTFEVPVALLMFRRAEGVARILERLSEIRPKRLYFIADYGRTEEEKIQADECRRVAESLVTWECEVIKHYASNNRGVYGNIALGAKWVFEREEVAIFLEDDNLPEISFFRYCEELLTRYKDDDRVFWICGTNYLGETQQAGMPSYHFTKCMLPCGWASWSEKFLKYYDFDLALMNQCDAKTKLKETYRSKALFSQQYEAVERELTLRESGARYHSWDYHLIPSIRLNGLLGIAPANNQIRNIGVDGISEHGGTSLNMVMTQRLCGMNSYPLSFPLIHPDKEEVDCAFEDATEKILLFPLRLRIKGLLAKIRNRLLGRG